jgi:hypothetical protein
MTRAWLAVWIAGIVVVYSPAVIVRCRPVESSFRAPLVAYGVGMVLLFAGTAGLTVTS